MFLKYLFNLAWILFILALSANPAWALNWNDPEWSERGCPLGLEGTWKAETTSSMSGQEIEFHKGGTFLVIRSGRDLNLKFKGDLKAGNRRFVDLEIMSGAKSSYPAILKARPHLGPGTDSSSAKGSCRIKLFRYENQKRAKQNREHSWDIYYAVQ